jgi:hypothetical protein
MGSLSTQSRRQIFVGKESRAYSMKSLFEQYREQFSDILYCCYCIEPKGDKWHCCQENHFIEFKDLDIEDQKAIIDEELDENT